MEEYSREKHRQRAREAYLKNSFDSLSDGNALEMLLFYSIPRKDVKDIANNLLNYFGSFENVFNADISDLQKVKGVGENTAILINLVVNINRRIFCERNKKRKSLSSAEAAKDFVKNELSNFNIEKILVICLDNKMKIINRHIVAEGQSGNANVLPISIIKCLVRDNAPNIIIAHNHPRGESAPSTYDINFTIEIINMCRRFNIKVKDHLIVGEEDVYSMASDIRYASYFD